MEARELQLKFITLLGDLVLSTSLEDKSTPHQQSHLARLHMATHLQQLPLEDELHSKTKETFTTTDLLPLHTLTSMLPSMEPMNLQLHECQIHMPQLLSQWDHLSCQAKDIRARTTNLHQGMATSLLLLPQQDLHTQALIHMKGPLPQLLQFICK